MSNSLSLVIPCYNESHRIGRTLRSASNFLDEHFAQYEILVVDDGSTDGTALRVHELSRTLPRVRLLTQGVNLGKGAAVRRGILSAQYDTVAMTDADLPYALDFLLEAHDALDKGADLAIGARNLKESSEAVGYPWYRRLTAWGFSTLVVRGLVSGISDTQCGIKCFRRSVAKHLFALATLRGFAFDVEILFLAQQFGYRIAPLPVVLSHATGSTVHLVRDSFRMWRDVRRISRQARKNWYATFDWDGERDRTCRICGGDLAKAATLDQQHRRRLVRCADCAWVTLLPIATDGTPAVSPQATTPAPRAFFPLLDAFLKSTVSENSPILEMTPAGHSWVCRLRTLGYPACSVQLPLDNIHNQLADFPSSVRSAAPLPAAIVHGVLENLVEPRRLLDALPHVLAPEAPIALFAEDTARQAVRQFRTTSLPSDRLPQVNYLSVDSMRRLLHLCRFEIIGILGNAARFAVVCRKRQEVAPASHKSLGSPHKPSH